MKGVCKNDEENIIICLGFGVKGLSNASNDSLKAVQDGDIHVHGGTPFYIHAHTDTIRLT